MRTIIFGGSFDPVHIGHLFLAQETMLQFQYERVIFVPAAAAPHKEPGGESTGSRRTEMLRAAVAGIEEFIVDDCEVRRGGRSYTIETVPLIQERYRPSGRLAMIIGDDLLDGFSSWRGHESLIAMVDILVAHRLSVKELDFSFPHRYVDNLLLPISSSDIRRRVASGRVYRHIVPEPVYKYIERYMLYRRRVEF